MSKRSGKPAVRGKKVRSTTQVRSGQTKTTIGKATKATSAKATKATGAKTVAPTPVTAVAKGKPATADTTALQKALGKLQNKEFNPKLSLPDVSASIPKGSFVERHELTPKGVQNARNVFDTLKPDIPVLLFPVRIETRYNASLTQLRIRIFPDQASIDTLDPRLTAEELAAGKAFLTELKRAADQDAKLNAWHSFATAYAPRRAAHIVRIIRAGGAEKTLREPGESHSALAPLLPDYWFVTGYANSRVAFDKVSNAVSRNIAFSPDLSEASDIGNDLAIDPAIRWMTDYGEAIKRGMAVTVNLPTWAREQIDEIYVLGVRTSDPTVGGSTLTPLKAARTLDNLLASHLHDWGAGFAAPATATNNTSDVEAGWSDAAVNLDDMFIRLIDEPANVAAAPNPAVVQSSDETMTATGALDASTTPEKTNHARLAKALGLPSNATLKRFENRTGSEDAVQAAMNILLWPVTWGEMLTQLLKGREETFFSKGTVDWLRDWFITSVRGGTPLPTLRLGRTSYGVLPVSKAHLSREIDQPDAEAQRQQLLGAQLRSLLPYWEAAANGVIRMGPWTSSLARQFPDPGDCFLQILRQQPYPARYFLSKAVSERNLFDLRYEIRNLIVHPDHNSQALQDIFTDIELHLTTPMFSIKRSEKAPGKAAYENWPKRFTSGLHQIEVLAGKRQLLLDILNPSSSIYADLYNVDALNVAAAVANAMKPREETIRSVANYLQEMIDICVDHFRANASFDNAIKPPSGLYNGVVGNDSDDPHLSFLSFDGELADWDTSAHVVVHKGEQAIGFDAQVDYLLGYAESFISSTLPPDEPTFPDGKKPLLFRLLKEAIYRTGIDEEASAISLFEMAEVTARSNANVATKKNEISGIVGAMETHEITDLTANLRSISGLKGRARVSAKDEPVARMLRDTSAKSLTELATTIDREVGSRKKDATFPAKEMTALSNELKAMGRAGDAAIKGLAFSRVADPRRKKITDMKEALTLLRSLNPDQIDLLMSQTMGLASWRLDAWLTSLPLRRIADLRDGQKRNGIQVGAFGWVQNLQPNNREAGDGNRVRSQGYVHTPSLNHAKTAAVLRAGWTNYGSDDGASPMAVDLTSNRMRDAHWIFTAVRQGQDLGDVLGYRFERYLKDTAKAPHWIYPIRQAVMSLTAQPFDPEQPGVDALELNRIVSTGRTEKLKSKAVEVLRELGGSDKTGTFGKVEQALGYLGDQIDALADAAIADSVHALVQGNLQRSGASLSAISDGEVPPPELDILRTVPSAQTQTHRVALMAPLSSGVDHAWVSDPSRYPGSAADPDAEALVAALLGPPDQLRITITYCDETGASIAKTVFSWADMLSTGSPFAVPALQTLMLLPADGLSESCDLVQRIIAHASAFPAIGVPSGATPMFDREAQDWTALDALMDRWLGWRAVVLDARPMAPRDILTGEDGEEVAAQIAGLEQRARSSLNALTRHAKTVLDALPEPQEGNETPTGALSSRKLLAAFDALAGLGIEGAVFRPVTRIIDAEACYQRAWRLAPTLRKKMKEADGIVFDTGAAPEARIGTARSALRLVFGTRFPGLCRLTSNTLPVIANSLSQSEDRLQKTTGGTPVQWIEKLGYVRPSLRALNDAMLIQDCQTGCPGGIGLQVAQWPEDDLQPWIAVDGIPSESPPKTSLVAALVPGAAPISGEITGLIIDEVVDRVPAKTVNTGVALHYDAPNTEAPQTLLLALPPVGERWSYATMIDTVRDAFQLARIRAVDGHQLQNMNQFLPAIYTSKATYPGGTS